MNLTPEPPKIALFLPLFNVAPRVGHVLESIPDSVFNRFSKIYLIDNRSTDGTQERVKAYLQKHPDPRFVFFQNKKNYFLGGSTIIAFRTAIDDGMDFLICMHSDGQADPNDLSQFLQRITLDLDFVFGSRFLPDSQTSEYSSLRYWANIFFSKIQHWVMGHRIWDIGSFIAFNLHSIQELAYEKIPHDMSYHPLLVLTLAKKRRLRFEEFPISWGKVENSSVNAWCYGFRHLLRLGKFALGLLPITNRTLSDFETERIPF